jgi:Domain of unknown function (4846)
VENNEITILTKIRIMLYKFICCSLFLLTIACNNTANSEAAKPTSPNKIVEVEDATAIKNIPLPEGYTRIENGDNSFATWLQNVGLKKDKTVYKFDGTEKYNQEAQYAVLDISVGTRDLQQCADAVMRLRAEYLFAQNRFDEISFTDNENIVYKFAAPFTKENFAKYLNVVFGMCGSASLAKQLKPANGMENIAAGNVIIRGGFPGHAVIVMDVAQNAEGKKIYLLAQSYMPAQDIHVLNNPINENVSPWYEANENDIIQTPEYTFKKTELMAW